jgi:hypothetical protein
MGVNLKREHLTVEIEIMRSKTRLKYLLATWVGIINMGLRRRKLAVEIVNLIPVGNIAVIQFLRKV